MLDVGSRRVFFRCEIMCQDQPLETKLESSPDFPHSEMRAARGPFFGIRFGHIVSPAFLIDRWNPLRKHLKPAAKKLGLPGVTWHLLRHQHATMLDSVGTPIGTMQLLLGHSTLEITSEIYLHAIPEEQRRAVESVERLVFGPRFLAPTVTSTGPQQRGL